LKLLLIGADTLEVEACPPDVNHLEFDLRAGGERDLDGAFTGIAGNDLTDGPLLMNPEALAQSALENLARAALGQLA
jgi:hypothetical protein